MRQGIRINPACVFLCVRALKWEPLGEGRNVRKTCANSVMYTLKHITNTHAHTYNAHTHTRKSWLKDCVSKSI